MYNFIFRFDDFIKIAGCQKQNENDRGIVTFSDCANVKDTNNEWTSFYGYKCDHESKIIDSVKYFVDSKDSFLVYVTFIPIGCKDLSHFAKRDNTKSEVKSYFDKIDEIGVSDEIRLVSCYYISFLISH